MARVAWMLFYGPIPAGKWVLHLCDQRECARPEHLYLGTAKSNAWDRECSRRLRELRSRKK
jgi:hypothetical protein